MLSVRQNSGVRCLISVSARRTNVDRCTQGGFNGSSPRTERRCGLKSIGAALVRATGKGAVVLRCSMYAPQPCDHLRAMYNALNFTRGCPIPYVTLRPGKSAPLRKGTLRRMLSHCGRPFDTAVNRRTRHENLPGRVGCIVSCQLVCYLHGNLPLSVSMCSTTR